MPLLDILDEFETLQKKTRKKRKFRGNIKNIEKIRKNKISVEISYRSPSITDISAEISKILFSGHNQLGLNQIVKRLDTT